jgi:hypothetical protein
MDLVRWAFFVMRESSLPVGPFLAKPISSYVATKGLVNQLVSIANPIIFRKRRKIVIHLPIFKIRATLSHRWILFLILQHACGQRA